ncbi:hypothetical protein FOB63_000675 [Clavispora lusitaniae]|uniref:uncharacterized protein n=1 Tax=Clavispora lusitaniae TaxID=36911 RepID=UPI00202C3CF3|nr:hypothetical protein FOB63_000675 [Clavispora lusitaniae]
MSASTSRRFSIALEKEPVSPSGSENANEPRSAFLVDNLNTHPHASLPSRDQTKSDQSLFKSHYSICDLNNFGDYSFDKSPQHLPDISTRRRHSVATDMKNHRRRNSVAIRFSIPKSPSDVESLEEV